MVWSLLDIEPCTIPSQFYEFHIIFPVLEEREVLQLKRQKLEYEELAPLTESVVENVERLLKVTK